MATFSWGSASKVFGVGCQLRAKRAKIFSGVYLRNLGVVLYENAFLGVVFCVAFGGGVFLLRGTPDSDTHGKHHGSDDCMVQQLTTLERAVP